jgi:hypothetical protein
MRIGSVLTGSVYGGGVVLLAVFAFGSLSGRSGS